MCITCSPHIVGVELEEIADKSQEQPDDDMIEEGPIAGSPPQSRRDARELVLKILYAQEFVENQTDFILQDLLSQNDNKYDKFVRSLLNKIELGQEEIDSLISHRSEKWDISRIAIVDKLILRLAIAEILYFPDIPPKVTINEAIEIAKRYSTGNSGRFINGILDAVYNSARSKKPEYIAKNHRRKKR